MAVTVFGVLLTWSHVVVVLRVLIVETGVSLMELNCLSPVILLRIVDLGELTYVVETMLSHQLVSIAVIFQVTTPCEKLSMWDCIPVEVITVTHKSHVNHSCVDLSLLIVTMDVECLHLCRRFVYISPLMTSENGSSYSVASLSVMAYSQLSDLSLCLLPWSDSGQPFLCGPQSSGR